jgi:hypothetical protein
MVVDGNNFISHYLKNNKPLCAGKIGVTELNLLYCDHLLNSANNFLPHLQHEVEDIAGLYPYTPETTKQFAADMKNALSIADLLPIWNRVIPDFEKFVFEKYCSKNTYFTQLQHLEPYFFEKPWTKYLENKVVLVISPFGDSIRQNFSNLERIWKGKIIPNFTLKVLKYPFALKITSTNKYKTSDEVYKFYIEAIRKETFDVAIIGTGYTSFLLAAECKRLGKAGIHLGGATQILFGIKGQRWKEIKEFQPLFNEHWTEPMKHEIPEKKDLVEGGCYW